jgi:hypothetical protein
MYNPDRLKFTMQKRLQTTMIGALARIEQHFGFLWGQDKDGELSVEQEDFLDRWEFLRNDILNYGNKQIRQLNDDFHKYGGVFKNNYSYNFPIKKDDTYEN